jgi:hypothetical protein
MFPVTGIELKSLLLPRWSSPCGRGTGVTQCGDPGLCFVLLWPTYLNDKDACADSALWSWPKWNIWSVQCVLSLTQRMLYTSIVFKVRSFFTNGRKLDIFIGGEPTDLMLCLLMQSKVLLRKGKKLVKLNPFCVVWPSRWFESLKNLPT